MTEKKTQEQDWMKMLEHFFQKAPQLSPKTRETLVKFVPVFALVFGILGLLFGVGAIGASPFALFRGVANSFIIFLSGAVAIVSSALLLMAYPKLKTRVYAGWYLLFCSAVVGVISVVLSFAIGSALGVVLGFYLLFQIKGYYK